jgi:hypothetical protein
MARAPNAPAKECATPESVTTLVSNLDGNPDQQESGAKHDQSKTRPIRFDPEAVSRSFRFQGVARGAKPPSTT